MNIVMVMSVYGQHAKGGAERSAATTAHYLVELGHQVFIISMGVSDQKPQPFTSEHGVITYQIPLIQIYDPYHLDGKQTKIEQPSRIKKALWHLIDIYNPLMGWQFGQILKNLKPDIFITHTLQGLSIAVWHEIRKTNAKLIHVVHDHALICPSTAMTKGVKVCEKVCMSCSVYSRLRHLLAARPDAVVGPSQIVLDRHHEFGWFNNVSKQVVIPNALPKNWPKAKPAHDIKSPIKFGFIGRLDESKGIDILLQALSYLSNYPLILYIAGSGDEMQIRKRWIINVELLHQVEFLGVVNAADFLSKIDVLITPSRAHETFCNVVMEAASLGRPSIVSNNGALPERVNQGQTGWIVDECTPLAFAKKMQHVMDNPNEIYEKGSNALKDIEKFNPKYQAASYEKLCVDLLSNNFDA